jgi:putative ATP-dependent endonuclease of OLD family
MMGIMLKRIRIQNFRSIESREIELGATNLLIGQNNTGKSNFLRAINVALGAMMDVTDADIYVADGERLPKTKSAIIDIMLCPTADDGSEPKKFSDFWMSVFTEKWIATSGDIAFVGIRTEVKLDNDGEDYVLIREPITQWGDTLEKSVAGKRETFTLDMHKFLSSFYMDANRDIVQDLRNRKSFFGRVTSGADLSEEKVDEIEAQLSSVNAMIVESIPSLQQTKERIAAIGRTIGSASSNVEIEPLTRKLSDLNRGMDIVMQDGGASFPISQNGYGTRSWISFLTLSAFVEIRSERIKVDDDEAEQFVMLTMEEPEAHLHPQAQRQLFSQIQNFTGQKVISTHSPSIIAQSAFADYLCVSKAGGKTTAIRYAEHKAAVPEEKIAREVINTRAELLFSSVAILCEGITEELVLPVYFSEFFNCSQFSLGVNIVNVRGKSNYSPYLSLLKDFNIPWLIFSDGESEAITAVSDSIKKVFNAEYADFTNVIILENGDEYETYLIREGYGDTIMEAICDYKEEANYFDNYMAKMDGQKRRQNFAKKHNLTETRDYYTNTSCGRSEALMDLCFENKTDYALPVAKKIVSSADRSKRIPLKVRRLFDELAKLLRVEKTTNSEE